MTPNLPPIVLVHGAWAGAWAWQRVLAPLRVAGHAVFAVTLSGCGERRHGLRRDITLQTHIADVTGLVEAEELHGVVLVGHSYGGLVVTGAANALLARDTAAVRQIVYVDAMVPLPGESWSSRHDEATRTARTAAARASGLNALPPPDPSGFGLSGPDREWLMRRQGPHPFNAYQEPLFFDADRVAAVPRTFIDCVSPAYPTIAPIRQRVRQTPGFSVVEMATGHYPQIQDPVGFVQLLRSVFVR
ncbi:MAG: alpha/beta hydrolase [Rhodoferax sp.]|nr:alpha/beta hydrolase [Rhodoferax sp.]